MAVSSKTHSFILGRSCCVNKTSSVCAGRMFPIRLDRHTFVNQTIQPSVAISRSCMLHLHPQTALAIASTEQTGQVRLGTGAEYPSIDLCNEAGALALKSSMPALIKLDQYHPNIAAAKKVCFDVVAFQIF